MDHNSDDNTLVGSANRGNVLVALPAMAVAVVVAVPPRVLTSPKEDELPKIKRRTSLIWSREINSLDLYKGVKLPNFAKEN